MKSSEPLTGKRHQISLAPIAMLNAKAVTLVYWYALAPVVTATAGTAGGNCRTETRCISFVQNQASELLSADGSCAYGQQAAGNGVCETECNTVKEYVCECVSEQVAEEGVAATYRTYMIFGAVGTIVGLLFFLAVLVKAKKAHEQAVSPPVDAPDVEKQDVKKSPPTSSKGRLVAFGIPLVFFISGLVLIVMGAMGETTGVYWYGCGEP